MPTDVREWLEQAGLRRGLDALGVGVSVHDLTGRLVHINQAGLNLLGWTSGADLALEEMASRLNIEGPGREPISPQDLPLSRVLAGRAEVDAQISVRLPTGIRRTLRVVARALHDERSLPCGAIQTFLDDGEAANARGAVRDLVEQSTPVLNVGERILLQPLIGTLDSQRAALAMEKLLEAIGTTGARVAIVDITGVSAVDTATANHLLRSLTAARLLGCEVVLSGVSPPIARTITVLGLDLSALRTKRDVAAAIAFGRRRLEAAESLTPREPTTTNDAADGGSVAPEKSPARPS